MGTTLSCFRIVIAARRDHSIDMTRLFERLATTPRIREKQATINPAKFNDDDARREMNVKVEEKSDYKDRKFEDEGKAEEELDQAEEAKETVVVDRSKRLRRSSSLKTDSTPRRRKIVRFADGLGLDLVDVRTFLAGIPKIPSSAYSDLIYDKSFPGGRSHAKFWGNGPATLTTPSYAATIPRTRPSGPNLERILAPLFQQPSGSASFLDQVNERLVCLENVVVADSISLAIHGTVRVRNLDFQKSVQIRYTLDSWRNFNDFEAIHVPNESDVTIDKFNFHLYCDTLKIGQKLEFAVRFLCKGSEYWDNNGGVNYCFRCLPALPINVGYIPIATSTNVTAPQFMLHCDAHSCSATFY